MQTPCDIKNDFPDEQGRWYTCPYSDDPTSEMCRLCQEPEENYDYNEEIM